jgi:hypothetical protein
VTDPVEPASTGATLPENEIDGSSVDPRAVDRVNRLLKWYPRDWRARYGTEFRALLLDTFSAGRGGLAMTLDVMREGLVARINESGAVGRRGAPIKRARASIAEVFVGTTVFLAAALLLAHYVERWRAYPTSVAVERAQRLVTAEYRAEHLWTRFQSLDPMQRSAAMSPYLREGQQQMSRAYASRVSGVPVVFHQIMLVSLVVAAAGLVAILVVAFFGGISALAPSRRRRMAVPSVLLVIAGALFVFGQLTPRSPWSPYGFSQQLKDVIDGRTWAWPTVAHSLCPLVGLVFLVIGGATLLWRAELGMRACQWIGRITIGVAALLGMALVCLVTWAATLSHQAPGYLFWNHQGILGSSLVSVFIVTSMAMAGGTALAVVGCRRCMSASFSTP